MNLLVRKTYSFLLIIGFSFLSYMLISNFVCINAMENENNELLNLYEDYYEEIDNDYELQEDLEKYVIIDENGKIFLDMKDEIKEKFNYELIEGIENNMIYLNEAIESEDIYINENLDVCISGTEDIVDLQDGNNKFKWRWYGFEIWLDSDTSLMVGLIAAVISKSVSYVTQVNLMSYVNKSIGYIDSSVENPGKYLHQTRIYKISKLATVLSGIVVGTAAIETALHASLPGIGSAFVAVLKVAVKIFVMMYGNYVFTNALHMIGYGLVKGQSYTRFKFGVIKVTY